MDPHSQDDLQRLKRICEQDSESFKWVRELYRKVVREVGGSHYGMEEERVKNRPYNELALADTILKMQLIGERPQVHIGSEDTTLEGFCYDVTRVLNKYLGDIHVEDVLRNWLGDAAACGIGIIKMGTAVSEPVEILEGKQQPSVEEFIENISPDHFGMDMRARSWSQVAYTWDRYTIPLEDAQEMGFDEKWARKLKADERRKIDDESDELAENLTRGDRSDYTEDLDPMVTLRDIYLRRQNVLVTVAENQWELGPGRVIDWEGPKGQGPHHVLVLEDIPGQLIGKSILADLIDLNEAENECMVKLIATAKSQKTITAVATEDDTDGKLFQKAKHGDQIGVNNPDAIKPISYPGPDQMILGFTMQVSRMISRLGGNLDAAGNLGPQAETLGQDRMIRAGLNDQMAKKAYRFIRATEGVIVHLGWMIWNDPVRDQRTYRATGQVADTDIEYPIELTSRLNPMTGEYESDWRGEFDDLVFSVDPFSSSYQSPAEKLMNVMQFMQNMVIPNMQMIMAQGGQVDWQKLMEMYAEYTSLSEVKSLITFPEPYRSPRDIMELLAGKETRMPAVTERINTRRNIPGASRQGQDEAMISMMTNQQQQPSQMASLARPVG